MHNQYTVARSRVCMDGCRGSASAPTAHDAMVAPMPVSRVGCQTTDTRQVPARTVESGDDGMDDQVFNMNHLLLVSTFIR